MKRAIARQRRTLADGRRLVNVVCPVCGGRHWLLADTTESDCPRHAGAFTVSAP